MDVLPTGLTYMHTHSCRYSRNKIQAKVQYIHTYAYQTHIRLIANIQVGAIRDILIKLRTNSILDACSSPRYESAYLATKYVTKKRKKIDPSPLLQLDDMCSDIKGFIVVDDL